MGRLQITKEFRFEMSHALEGYQGLCKNIHGHSYILSVTIQGKACEDVSASHFGMLMDFSELKQMVNRSVVEPWDHALMLRKDSKMAAALAGVDTKKVEVIFQPTCENMVQEIARIIEPQLPSHLKLHRVKLHETANSYAEYFPD